jgi:sulfate adenylyltransferase
VSRNYGATGFVVGKHISPEARRWLLKHHDELGLDIIPVRVQRPQAAQQTTRHPLCEAA